MIESIVLSYLGNYHLAAVTSLPGITLSSRILTIRRAYNALVFKPGRSGLEITATMTNKRQTAISRSIHRALLREDDQTGTKRYNVLALIFAFLSIWQIRLVRISAQLFKSLRKEVWDISEVDYIDSFVLDKKKADGAGILPMGDLGYSGSV